jgi:hypothetical protein
VLKQSIDKDWLDLRSLFVTTDPDGWVYVFEHSLSDETFRWALRKTGASEALIEAHGRFKDMLRIPGQVIHLFRREVIHHSGSKSSSDSEAKASSVPAGSHPVFGTCRNGG